MELWYEKPAEHWLEALPAGNGALGGMVYGGTNEERISLNEETLWSGRPRSTDNLEAAGYLSEARRLVFTGKYGEAHRFINENMLSSTNTESYMPLGDLRLSHHDFRNEFSGYRDYRRTLDLDRALLATEFTSSSGARICRQIFISRPAGVMLIRLDSSEKISTTFSFASLLEHGSAMDRGRDLVLAGRAPTHVEPSYRQEQPGVVYDREASGLSFEARLRVLSHNGSNHEPAGGSLTVYNATEIVLAVTASTNFAGYAVNPEDSPVDPSAVNRDVLDRAEKRGYESLLDEHREDYRALFGRVSLDLGSNERDSLPTDVRLARLDNPADDPSLVSLLYQYGRYLLIAASREGGQPANLQGIWNKEIRPPWSSNMTMNINAQMNYWLAESTNLSECHDPFFRMLADLAEKGQSTAKTHFGCGGSLCAHNTDIWRFTTPVRGDATHAQWPMGLAWSCGHIWEHYCFTRDRAFLKAMVPVMRESALFLLDYLTEDPATGRLTTCPSTSPENSFFDPETEEKASVCQGSTMDLAVIEELFRNLIDSEAVLGESWTGGDGESLTGKLQKALENLARPKIGSRGQLLEFNGEFREVDPLHRHVSHLYGAYPGSLYTDKTNADFFRAAMKSLDLRGDLSTGWAMAWRIALWARFGEGDRALGVVKNFLHLISPNETVKGASCSGGGGIYANMFCAHPPFQIDGNYGATAGLTELFVQSHVRRDEGKGDPHFEIRLLPALPSSFPKGEIAGVKARGNVTVSLSWDRGELERVVLVSPVDGDVALRYGEIEKTVSCKGNQPMTLRGREFS